MRRWIVFLPMAEQGLEDGAVLTVDRQDLHACFASASSMMIFPAITSDSLLARAMVFPVLMAERVGMRPTAPTMAETT